MSISGCRIDGRLVHGQVANLWTTRLGISRIMVIDDDVAQNAIEKSALKMATPSGVKLSVLPVEKAAKNIMDGKYDSQSLLIVAKKPDRFLRLVEYGVPLEEINVGNMSKTDNGKQVTRSITVEEKDLDAFKALKDKGVKLNCQMVPQDKGEDFIDVLGKAGITL